MFTDLDLHPARERNAKLPRGVEAARLKGRLRADRDRDRDLRPGGLRRTIAAFLALWSGSAGPRRTGGGETGGT